MLKLGNLVQKVGYNFYQSIEKNILEIKILIFFQKKLHK
jgi:hypothetical protein